jgi:hypothetical protein
MKFYAVLCGRNFLRFGDTEDFQSLGRNVIKVKDHEDVGGFAALHCMGWCSL